MIALLVAFVLGQSSCAAVSASVFAAANEHAVEFDLRGAMTSLAADLSSCAETSVAYW